MHTVVAAAARSMQRARSFSTRASAHNRSLDAFLLSIQGIMHTRAIIFIYNIIIPRLCVIFWPRSTDQITARRKWDYQIAHQHSHGERMNAGFNVRALKCIRETGGKNLCWQIHGRREEKEISACATGRSSTPSAGRSLNSVGISREIFMQEKSLRSESHDEKLIQWV